MSVWKDIREKSLGKSFRKEDAENISFTALPASTNVTILVNKINQLDNEIFNDCMLDDWMVPKRKVEISIDAAASSIESLGDVGLRDLEKSIYLKCLDLEKEYDRKKDDYDRHRFPKDEEFDLPF